MVVVITFLVCFVEKSYYYHYYRNGFGLSGPAGLQNCFFRQAARAGRAGQGRAGLASREPHHLAGPDLAGQLASWAGQAEAAPGV